MDAALINELRFGLIFYILLVCSLSIHEWAHAFTADKLGDPLPRTQGRVTLNPLAHMDMLGTVVFPLIMIFGPIFAGMGSSFILLGWGKPVMLSLPDVRTRKRDDMLVTAAGPLSNLLICLIVAVAMPFLSHTLNKGADLFELAIVLNVALLVFNLIPIPPLDGSHFLKYLVGMSEEVYYTLSRWGFLILLILINISTFRHALGKLIIKVVTLFLDLSGYILKLIS